VVGSKGVEEKEPGTEGRARPLVKAAEGIYMVRSARSVWVGSLSRLAPFLHWVAITAAACNCSSGLFWSRLHLFQKIPYLLHMCKIYEHTKSEI
jgi:hypothetical protein